MYAESTVILSIIDDRILLVDSSGVVTLETLLHINEAILLSLAHTQEPLHIIYNDVNMSGFGTDINTLTRASSYLMHPKMGICVAMRSTNLVAFMRRLTCKLLTTSRPHTVHTLEEALNLLRRMDDTLPHQAQFASHILCAKIFH